MKTRFLGLFIAGFIPTFNFVLGLLFSFEKIRSPVIIFMAILFSLVSILNYKMKESNEISDQGAK